MVSIRSATSTVLLCELVVSCAMIIASLAVVAAQSQSGSENKKKGVEPVAIAVVFLSASMMLSDIVAMFGLAKHRLALILPHLFISVIVCGFHATFSIQTLLEWLRLTGFDGYWLFAAVTAGLFQVALWIAISLEARCYRFSILAGEMVLLVAGEAGIGVLHGWTEGVGYAFQRYYTPLWACAILMIELFLLIISLFFVFVGLHFNNPGIIKHHIIALIASWPLAISIVIGAIISGAPFLVGFCLILYFSTLLPFAYIYSTAKWESTETPKA